MVSDNAITINPPYGNPDEAINAAGSIVSWTFFSIYVAFAIGVTAWLYTTPKKQRVFHYLTLGSLLVAIVSSFTVAADLGSTAVQAEFRAGAPFLRQVFYVRFIDWFVSVPLILTEVLLLSGIELDAAFFTILAVEVSVVGGLIASLTPSVYKFGYFVLAIAFQAYAYFHLAFTGRRAASHLAADAEKFYNMLVIYFLAVGLLYPIAWGLSEGGNVIGLVGEEVFYGINDLLIKVAGGFFILFGVSRYPVDFERFGLARHAVAHEKATTIHPRDTQETAREPQQV